MLNVAMLGVLALKNKIECSDVTVIQHSTHYPMSEGLNLVTGTGREKKFQKLRNLFEMRNLGLLGAILYNFLRL
jgi:hypothetical protein